MDLISFLNKSRQYFLSNFWSTDLDWIYYDDKSTPNALKLVNSNWKDLINNDDWRELFDFYWGMRILLWPALIEANKIEVRFIHDGENGEGEGPLIFFGETSTIQEQPVEDFIEEFAGIVLADGFACSDQFDAENDDVGFLGLKQLPFDYLYYRYLDVDEENDDVGHEFTYSAEWRIKSNKSNLWKDLSSEQRNILVSTAVEIYQSQMELIGEMYFDIRDVLACAALHPSTEPELKLKIQELKDDFISNLLSQ
jgi:hypothetical protein